MQVKEHIRIALNFDFANERAEDMIEVIGTTPVSQKRRSSEVLESAEILRIALCSHRAFNK